MKEIPLNSWAHSKMIQEKRGIHSSFKVYVDLGSHSYVPFCKRIRLVQLYIVLIVYFIMTKFDDVKTRTNNVFGSDGEDGLCMSHSCKFQLFVSNTNNFLAEIH